MQYWSTWPTFTKQIRRNFGLTEASSRSLVLQTLCTSRGIQTSSFVAQFFGEFWPRDLKTSFWNKLHQLSRFIKLSVYFLIFSNFQTNSQNLLERLRCLNITTAALKNWAPFALKQFKSYPCVVLFFNCSCIKRRDLTSFTAPFSPTPKFCWPLPRFAEFLRNCFCVLAGLYPQATFLIFHLQCSLT